MIQWALVSDFACILSHIVTSTNINDKKRYNSVHLLLDMVTQGIKNAIFNKIFGEIWIILINSILDLFVGMVFQGAPDYKDI